MVALKKIIITFIVGLFLVPMFVFAEDKPQYDAPGTQIPKLSTSETQDAPILKDNEVYPFWGPICQRYTYSVIYQDSKGRAPEYMQIYFNGKMIDMEKEDPDNNDYKNGAKYIYKYVPTKIGSNFYYFEASNGVGKSRAAIIDSPDNGPVLFASDFKNNEIVLYDKEKGSVAWRYPTNEEWIGGVALSRDGKYLAVQSSYHIYLFDTSKNEPLWIYDSQVNNMIGGDVKGGIDISADGEKIFAALGSKALLFNKNSNKPIWEYVSSGQVMGSAYNVSISADGKYAGSSMAGGAKCDKSQGQCQEKDALIFWNTDSNKPLWQYQANGNFHDISISADGQYLATATGCPDRRAYIFSRDSNKPVVRSEMLTKDSPVDEASISADGTYSAFGTESSAGGVFLFDRNSSNPVWEFPSPNSSSVRALNMTPDAQFIGAATMADGNAYIFSRDSNNPIDHWNVNAILGAMDIADDGSYIAVGGTDKKVHIFERGQVEEKSRFDISEFVGEIDISGNGKFIATGTSGSVYFFEALETMGSAEVAECSTIIEPSPKPTVNNINISSPNNKNGLGLPLKISSIIFIFSLIFSAIYLYLIKKKKIVSSRLVAILLLIIIIASFSTSLFFIFWKDPNNEKLFEKEVQVIDKQEGSEIKEEPSSNNSDEKREVIKSEGGRTNVINNSEGGDAGNVINNTQTGDSETGNVINQDSSSGGESGNVIIENSSNSGSSDSSNVINQTDGSSSGGEAGVVVDQK